jgi:hypothetical protein
MHHAMENHVEVEAEFLAFINSATFTPLPLHPTSVSRYPLHRRLVPREAWTWQRTEK